MPPARRTPDAPESKISKRRRAALSGKGNSEYQEKRAELLQIAAEVFNELGYEATSVQDIAERFGADRASLYYYASGKEELFQALVEETLVKNHGEAVRVQGLKENARERLRLLINRLVQSYVDSYPSSYVYIESDMTRIEDVDSPWAKRMRKLTRDFERITIKLIQEGVDEGLFRNDVPVILASNSLFGMLNWTHRWFKPGGKWTVDELVDAFTAIFFSGIEPRT